MWSRRRYNSSHIRFMQVILNPEKSPHPRTSYSILLTTWFAARRWPWCFGGTIIVIHKINVSILRGKTHMIMTFSHPNMTCVSEKRSFHESRKLFFLNIKREFRASPGFFLNTSYIKVRTCVKYVPKQSIA